jgi:signal transduction histidine kinase
MDRTARIAAGDCDAIGPLSHHGTREMAELSQAFLDMAQKLQARSDTIRTFATHVSHELKSPLTAIQGAAELLRDGGAEMDQTQHRRFCDNIVTDTDRLNQLVRRLIELAIREINFCLPCSDGRIVTRIRLPSFGALAMWRQRSGSSIAFPLALLRLQVSPRHRKRSTQTFSQPIQRIPLHTAA